VIAIPSYSEKASDKTAELSTAVWLGGRVVRRLDL